jgi:hypothetical protein
VGSNAELDLESKVDLLSKAVNLLIFGKKEIISKKEAKEIQKRLGDYVKGNESEFVNLEDISDAKRKNPQKSSKRA